MDNIEEMEELFSDESIEELFELLKYPTNLLQLNSGQWDTVSAPGKFVYNIGYWMQVYFMAETIKTTERSKSYLYKILNSLLEPRTANAKAYKEQENPTRYVSLLFFTAFCDL